MKAITVLTIALLAASSLYIHKRFSSEEENYSVRLANIANHVNSMNGSWTAEDPSRFRNLPKAQVKALMGTFLDDNTVLPVRDYTGYTAPDTFDSRTAWPNCESLQQVRDQANCGSCWAFGAVEAMSDRICIKSGQKDQTRISSEDLVDCCYSCGNGCSGGYPSAAWSYFRNTGLVTGNLYGENQYCKPYVLPPCAHHTTSTKYPACPAVGGTPSCKKTCNPEFKGTYSSDIKKGLSVISVTGEANMMNEISTHGPIEVAFTVYEDFLTYKSGVYHHTTGSALGGHAVKAVGYGTEGGVKYWLIANSWNETWGDNGYFKIKRGNNECGIERQGVAGDV